MRDRVTRQHIVGLSLVLAVLAVGVLVPRPASAQFAFGPAVNVSQNAGLSRMPSMVLDAAGTLHIAWTDDSSGVFQILTKRSFDRGQTFTAPVQVSTSNNGSVRPKLAAFGGALYMVWMEETTAVRDIMFSRSLDGGASWSAPQNLSNTPAAMSQEGRIAVGPNGTIYVVWDEVDSGIQMARSFDGGASFETPRTLFGIAMTRNCAPGQPTGACTAYPGIAIDQSTGTVYLVWHDGPGVRFEIRFSRSADNGNTFSAPQQLTNLASSTGDHHAHCAGISVGPSGRISIAFEFRKQIDPHAHDSMFIQSTNGGASFTAPINLSNGPSWAFSDYPTPAEAPNGIIVVGWEDNTRGEQTDAVLAVSTDGGASFPPSSDLSNNPASPSAEIFPLFGPDGSLYLAWEEDDPSFTTGEIFLVVAAGTGTPPPPPPPPGFFSGGVYVSAANLTGGGGPDIVTGAGAGGGPHVKAFTADNSQLGPSFFAYAASFGGGVRVASCSFFGQPGIVTGAGPGGGPHVQVLLVEAFATSPIATLASFFAYDPSFTGGVFVACGDLDGDGIPEIVTGADAGGGPHVRVWKLTGGGVTEIANFFAYPLGFTGGVRVAVGQVDGSGVNSIITGAGPGGGPHVRVWQLTGGGVTEIAGFFAYAPNFTGGVFVAAGDVDGDGLDEIVTGADAGGGPHVRVWDADFGVVLEAGGFFAYDPGFTGGVRVAAGLGAIITGPGPGGGPHVRIFNGNGVATQTSFFAY